MKIAILGAGISGLSAAWYLEQAFKDKIQIHIFEKTDRVGGLIQSKEHEGFFFEYGPRGFSPKALGQHTLELASDLGLNKDLIAADTAAKKRYIWSNQKLKRASLIYGMQKGLMGALVRDFFVKPSKLSDETIAQFSARHFGDRFTKHFLDPFVCGIYGGSIHNLSIESCFPTLWDLDQKQGSIFKALFKKRKKTSASLYSFRKGMESLPKKIAETIQGSIYTQSPVHTIESLKKGWCLHLAGSTFEADLVISALPLRCLHSLMGIDVKLPYQSLTAINLGYLGVKLPLKGFGFLVPYNHEDILGITLDSAIFPEHNHQDQVRICVMTTKHDHLLEMAIRYVHQTLGIDKKPTAYHVHHAPQAICHYPVGFQAHFRNCIFPDRFINATPFQGIGVNACIGHAKTLQNRVRTFME